MKEGAWHAHDAILEMLNLHEAGRARLGHGGEGGGGGGVTNGDSGKGGAYAFAHQPTCMTTLVGLFYLTRASHDAAAGGGPGKRPQ